MNHVRKQELPFNNKILVFLFKMFIFIIAIPLVFIYVPLRFIARKLSKFILFLIQAIPKFIQAIPEFILVISKFFIRLIDILFPKGKEIREEKREKKRSVKLEHKRNREVKVSEQNKLAKFFANVGEKIVLFLSWLTAFHPYKGDNVIIKYLDTNITGEKVEAQKMRSFIFFLVPALGSFTVFVITPFLMGVFFSFTDWTGLNNGNEVIVGFQNYSTIFSDYLFVYSFIRTTLYSVLNVIVINVVAFSLALVVTQNLKLKNVYRAGFFLPNLIGGLVLGYIWQFVYSNVFPAIGTAIGWESGIFSHSLIGGYASSSEAMGALIAVVAWQYAGYIMMIYIAALQNVPTDLIEASKIDGANAFQRLRTIIFPLVAQAFTIALFLTLVTSFKQFDTVISLTGGGPSALIPEYLAKIMDVPTWSSVNSLDLMTINIYETAFSHYEMGIGQAKAIVFFLILLIVGVAQVTYSQKKEVEL